MSKHSGKQVALTMQGEDTEIDRNVVEELYDPMIHMIRNAVDHGIEDPATREANGKPPAGVVTLRAYRRGGNVVIEIADDGKGLDRDAILQKARASGLIGDDANPTDSEIFHMIFEPGLSTAKKVIEISGRGVDMDFVKNPLKTGGAIMGDDRVGLILDMAGLFDTARKGYSMGPVRKPEPGDFQAVAGFPDSTTTPAPEFMTLNHVVTRQGDFY